MKKIIIAIVAILFAGVTVQAVKMKDLKIYINPGHGGYDSDDRGLQIYPFAQGDTLGYWESKSNLYKGLHMYHILKDLGATPYLSRIKNRTEDDRSLSGISQEANELKADLFFSIHSNAGESVNYPLMLYRENAIGTPRYPENVVLSNMLWKNLHSSKVSLWTRDTPYVAGDLTFYEGQWVGGLGVLRSLYVVGLLSEGGMHEHRPEAHRLMSDDFCWLEAWHFVHTVMEYFDVEDKFTTGNIAGVVYDNHNLRERIMPATFTMHGRDKNAPLNGVKVVLKNTNGDIIQERTTDNMYNGVFVFRDLKPGDYKIIVDDDKYYPNETNVTVVANQVSYADAPLDMRRESPLVLESYSPQVEAGSTVSCVVPIIMNFNHDIDEVSFKQAFKIEPAVDGDITFTNSFRTVQFKPTIAYEPNVTYNVTLSTELKTPDPNYTNPNLAQPFSMSFTTVDRNKLEMLYSYPAEGEGVHYESPVLEFRFDKKLASQLALPSCKIVDKNENQLLINSRASSYNKLTNGYGNVIIALVDDLVVGETYKAIISGDLRDSEGVPLTDDVIINFKAVDHGQVKIGDVLESFETSGLFKYDEDDSKGLLSAPIFSLATSKVLFGKSSNKVSYNFASHKDGEMVIEYTGKSKTIINGNIIGIHINGDVNNHELYVGVKTGTDLKYTKICDINFAGWKYFEVKLTNLEEGQNYQFTNLKLVQKEALYAQKGAFYLDDMILNSSVSGVEDATMGQINITPNPATDKVTITGVDNLTSVELFNTQGGIVLSSKSNVIMTGQLSAGIYLVKINTTTGTIVRRLIKE